MLIPDKHLDEEPGILERLRRGERIDHYETIRRRKDGELINVSLTVSPIKDGTGRIIGASKIARDITRQKRAEELIREQAHVLALLDTTGRTIASQLDLQNVLQTVTDTATQLTGAKFGAFFYNVISDQGEAFLLYTLVGRAARSVREIRAAAQYGGVSIPPSPARAWCARQTSPRIRATARWRRITACPRDICRCAAIWRCR